MITSELDLVLVLLASAGSSMIFAGIAKALGLDAVLAALMGGGLPLLAAWRWHFRVIADREAAYVRQTDANTQVKLASLQPAVVDYGPADPTPDQAEALEDAWYTALRIFFRNGEVAGGFSHTRLVVSGSMTDKPWAELTTFYAKPENGAVLRIEAPEGYVRGHGWTFDTIREALMQRRLPHPDGSPPEVVILPSNATQRDASRRKQAVGG